MPHTHTHVTSSPTNCKFVVRSKMDEGNDGGVKLRGLFSYIIYRSSILDGNMYLFHNVVVVVCWPLTWSWNRRIHLLFDHVRVDTQLAVIDGRYSFGVQMRSLGENQPGLLLETRVSSRPCSYSPMLP